MQSILILNGPNLNLLGTRQPEIYGAETLEMVEKACVAHAKSRGLAATCFQSNHEGVLIDRIHEARDAAQAIVINPGGLTHTSVALLDALAAFDGPVIEVHLSNVHAREPFRHHSYLSDKAVGVICGLGARGYEFALQSALERIG